MTVDNGVPPIRPSGTVVIGAIVALVFLAGAAVLFVGSDEAATQRLALFLGILSPTIVGLSALLRADTAAARVDGSLDDRVQQAVLRAQSVRRHSDVVPENVDELGVAGDPADQDPRIPSSSPLP